MNKTYSPFVFLGYNFSINWLNLAELANIVRKHLIVLTSSQTPSVALNERCLYLNKITSTIQIALSLKYIFRVL